MTTKQITTTQTSSPPEPSRASLAIASDPSKALRLSPTFQPDVDLLTAEGLIAFGVKGSGKSNLLALLVEQLGRFLLPQLIIDTEREYQSLAHLLPRGVIAAADRCPSGSDIIHKGLQVIVDLQSWQSDEAAALSLCQLIEELFTATTAIAPHERVPCVIHLDEAAYWLPQEAVVYLSKETRKALADAFHKLASRGRKQGLTPLLYTQSISEVAKSAIRQAGIKVLMRQTLDVDLTRYCQYIQGATPRTKKAIQAYPSGRAVVILPDGSQHKVQFNTRQSEHVSQTPQAQAALVKFAAMDIDVTALPMRDMTAEGQPDRAQGRLHQSVQPGKGRLSPTPPTTATERVYALLAENPTLRPAELMKLTGCSDTTASKARRTYFELHPEQQVVPQKTVTERIHDLLAANPALPPAELMKLTGCSDTTAFRARKAYFEWHPEQQAASTPPTMTERLYALLAENPALRPAELRKLVGCDHTLAAKARRVYFELHSELAPTHTTATERIHGLLAANPTLSPAELRKLVGCDHTLVGRVHKAYFVRHPELAPTPPPTATERIYVLLAENPALRPAELMRVVGCSDTAASRARRTYFERHPEQQGPEYGKQTHATETFL